MKLLFNRTKMIGGGCSYDIYIPVEEHPYSELIKGYVMLSSGNYFNFDKVFITPEHDRLPVGIERYDSWKDLEAKAIELEDKLLREYFSELKEVERHNLSFLWIPEIDLESTSFFEEVDLTEQQIQQGAKKVSNNQQHYFLIQVNDDEAVVAFETSVQGADESLVKGWALEGRHGLLNLRVTEDDRVDVTRLEKEKFLSLTLGEITGHVKDWMRY